MDYRFAELPNKQKICYVIYNQNSQDQQAIILVHGNFSSIEWWKQTIQGLIQTNKKIVAYDQRGFGQSSYNNKCSSFGDWASDLIQFLQILKIKKAILIGWSFGGAICQKAAQIAPHKITKLILTCSVSHEGLPMPNQEGKNCKTPQQITKLPKIVGTLAILNSKNKQMMRNIFQMLLYKKMEHADQKRKAELVQSPFSQRNYVELLTALTNSDIKIDSIKAKTLLIHGTEDLVLPVQTIMGTASKLGKLDLWEGHAHMIPIENTKRYLETVINFIKQ